jgi:hypothetical protein
MSDALNESANRGVRVFYRACPGRELANANMYLLMSMMLSVFDLSKAVDAKGNVIEPKWEFGSGTVR